MTSSYFIKLNQFEGPLDLLLYLIKVNELNIFQIDLFLLTTQYLEYLRLMQFSDIKDASAFLEMAASLIEIKTRHLLPNDQQSINEDEDLEDEEDPAVALQRRLIEYETFRKAAEYISSQSQAQMIATNSEWKRLEPQYADIEGPLRGDYAMLLVLYEQMLGSLSERRPVTVKATTETIGVDEVIKQLKGHLKKVDFFMFQILFSKMSTRYELVAYVLAALQLVRDREMKIFQDDLEGPLWLYQNHMSEQDIDTSETTDRQKAAIPQGRAPDLQV